MPCHGVEPENIGVHVTKSIHAEKQKMGETTSSQERIHVLKLMGSFPTLKIIEEIETQCAFNVWRLDA